MLRKCWAKSWRSNQNSRCGMRGYHTCRNRQTWSKGTAGCVPSDKGTLRFCLPRKDFGVAPRKRTFSFPGRGPVFPKWNCSPLLRTWVSCDKDQGSWNPLGSPGPQVPPGQITFVLARDRTGTPDPTDKHRWACPILSTRPWRMVQKYSHKITYYTPTSRNLKTSKTRLCNNTRNNATTNRVAKTTTLHES